MKSVGAATGIRLTPTNCVVAVSTPVKDMYRRLGFRIAPLELGHPDQPPTAWEVLEMLAHDNPAWKLHAHPATIDVFERYGLAQHIKVVMGDPVVGSEGSLTDTRDYRTYTASFEDAAVRKWSQARPYVVPGRIVDVGCASGAMLELASRDPGLAESDLFGIEVAQHLYEECIHKKSQGYFSNPNTFFFQRNILAGRVFPDASIDTTLTFALTHEIFSYAGGPAAVKTLVANIHRQTVPGGVWINSDVCGPADGDTGVELRFVEPGLDRPAVRLDGRSAADVKSYLASISPAARLAQFAQDFPAKTGAAFNVEVVDERTGRLSLADAMEFMSKHTYVDNWLSECHERFCALDWSAWSRLVESAGFEIDPRSGPWRNDWVVTNRSAPSASLFRLDGSPLDWPDTHLFLVARRPVQES